MYELFLSSIVNDDDLKMACAILGGLCAQEPWHDLHHVVFFRGPKEAQPRGFTRLEAAGIKAMRKDLQMQWRDLVHNLARQSYVVRTKYEVFKDRDFGVSVPNLNVQQGILHWTDFPDPPPHARPDLTPIMQRKKVEIWEQKNLLKVLNDNNYIVKNEIIEEALHFFRDDVEFCLFRHYALTAAQGDNPQPLATLPPWDKLTPVDSENRWLFVVKYHVLQDNKPDEIKKGQDILLGVKKELEGVFDFRVFDRRCHDTRIAVEEPNGHGSRTADGSGRTCGEAEITVAGFAEQENPDEAAQQFADELSPSLDEVPALLPDDPLRASTPDQDEFSDDEELPGNMNRYLPSSPMSPEDRVRAQEEVHKFVEEFDTLD